MNKNSKTRRQQSIIELETASEIERMVSRELLQMGFSYKHIGTVYLRQAIMMMVDTDLRQTQTMRNLCTVIYKRISQAHGVDFQRVNICIRNSIERVFCEGDIDYLLEIFKKTYNPENGRVDNATFIVTVAEKVKWELYSSQTVTSVQIKQLIQESIDQIADIATLGNLYGIIRCLEGGKKYECEAEIYRLREKDCI